MAIMNGAVVELISKNYTRRESRKTAVILHTAASKATGHGHYLYWNRDPRARASSHFYVDYDGTIHQLVDTAHSAWASGNANSFSIGIETQGWGNEPWTPEQVRALARILAWCHKTHGIPLVEMTNSSQRRGIGYHRLGVAATRSQYAQGKSQTGGTLWSSAIGKVCPGAQREAQIPHIISLAGGANTPAPSVKAGKPAHVSIDGWWGPATTRAIQFINQRGGAIVDGVVSSQPAVNEKYLPHATSASWKFVRHAEGSLLVKILQRAWGATPDGYMGANTVKAMQRYYGVAVDGIMGADTVRAFQQAINNTLDRM